MLNNNSEILFTKDILEKTAKDLGITKRTVEYIYQFALDYMYKQIDSTDCCSFYLPKLGTLYVSSRFVSDTVAETNHKIEKLKEEGQPENTFLNKKKKTFEHKQALLRKFIYDMNRPNSQSYHHSKDRLNLKSHTAGYSLNDIEDMQNDLYWLAKKENIEFDEFD